ncbi:hypothetical protein M9Y10_030345 [Tritrichomonas musculus]|uniref:Uncharacterized protein n=1 Tax=Tritrichomonas musculus TaxID=1915356 RepID=A0ABR2KQ80_9EUKA
MEYDIFKEIEKSGWSLFEHQQKLRHAIISNNLGLQTISRQISIIRFFTRNLRHIPSSYSSISFAGAMKQKPLKFLAKFSTHQYIFVHDYLVKMISYPHTMSTLIGNYFTKDCLRLHFFARVTFPSLFHNFVTEDLHKAGAALVNSIILTQPVYIIKAFFFSFLGYSMDFFISVWTYYEEKERELREKNKNDKIEHPDLLSAIFIKSLEKSTLFLSNSQTKLFETLLNHSEEVFGSLILHTMFPNSFCEYFQDKVKEPKQSAIVQMLQTASFYPNSPFFKKVAKAIISPQYTRARISHRETGFVSQTPIVLSLHELFIIQQIIFHSSKQKSKRDRASKEKENGATSKAEANNNSNEKTEQNELKTGENKAKTKSSENETKVQSSEHKTKEKTDEHEEKEDANDTNDNAEANKNNNDNNNNNNDNDSASSSPTQTQDSFDLADNEKIVSFGKKTGFFVFSAELCKSNFDPVCLDLNMSSIVAKSEDPISLPLFSENANKEENQTDQSRKVIKFEKDFNAYLASLSIEKFFKKIINEKKIELFITIGIYSRKCVDLSISDQKTHEFFMRTKFNALPQNSYIIPSDSFNLVNISFPTSMSINSIHQSDFSSMQEYEKEREEREKEENEKEEKVQKVIDQLDLNEDVKDKLNELIEKFGRPNDEVTMFFLVRQLDILKENSRKKNEAKKEEKNDDDNEEEEEEEEHEASYLELNYHSALKKFRKSLFELNENSENWFNKVDRNGYFLKFIKKCSAKIDGLADQSHYRMIFGLLFIGLELSEIASQISKNEVKNQSLLFEKLKPFVNCLFINSNNRMFEVFVWYHKFVNTFPEIRKVIPKKPRIYIDFLVDYFYEIFEFDKDGK